MHLSVFLSRKRLGLHRKCGTIGFNFQKNLEMWEHRAVGTSGLIFQNKSGNIGLWEHRAYFSKLSVKKKSLEMWEHRAVGTEGYPPPPVQKAVFVGQHLLKLLMVRIV